MVSPTVTIVWFFRVHCNEHSRTANADKVRKRAHQGDWWRTGPQSWKQRSQQKRRRRMWREFSSIIGLIHMVYKFTSLLKTALYLSARSPKRCTEPSDYNTRKQQHIALSQTGKVNGMVKQFLPDLDVTWPKNNVTVIYTNSRSGMRVTIRCIDHRKCLHYVCHCHTIRHV